MQPPIPGAEHRRLETMAGEWEGEETTYASPVDSKGNTAIGRIHSRMGLDGFALIHDYERERNGKVTFSGHGVFTYDSEQQHYHLSWCDSTGAPPTVFTGQFAGDTLRLTYHGLGMHARLSHDLSAPGSIFVSMEMSEDGATWAKLFDARMLKK